MFVRKLWSKARGNKQHFMCLVSWSYLFFQDMTLLCTDSETEGVQTCKHTPPNKRTRTNLSVKLASLTLNNVKKLRKIINSKIWIFTKLNTFPYFPIVINVLKFIQNTILMIELNSFINYIVKLTNYWY